MATSASMSSASSRGTWAKARAIASLRRRKSGSPSMSPVSATSAASSFIDDPASGPDLVASDVDRIRGLAPALLDLPKRLGLGALFCSLPLAFGALVCLPFPHSPLLARRWEQSEVGVEHRDAVLVGELVARLGQVLVLGAPPPAIRD